MNIDKIIDLIQMPVNLPRDSPREYSLKWSMKRTNISHRSVLLGQIKKYLPPPPPPPTKKKKRRKKVASWPHILTTFIETDDAQTDDI